MYVYYVYIYIYTYACERILLSVFKKIKNENHHWCIWDRKTLGDVFSEARVSCPLRDEYDSSAELREGSERFSAKEVVKCRGEKNVYPPVIKHGNGKSHMNGGMVHFSLPCLFTGG